jgi:hypothetical protein
VLFDSQKREPAGAARDLLSGYATPRYYSDFSIVPRIKNDCHTFNRSRDILPARRLWGAGNVPFGAPLKGNNQILLLAEFFWICCSPWPDYQQWTGIP